jgi:hypothetical protein
MPPPPPPIADRHNFYQSIKIVNPQFWFRPSVDPNVEIVWFRRKNNITAKTKGKKLKPEKLLRLFPHANCAYLT